MFFHYDLAFYLIYLQEVPFFLVVAVNRWLCGFQMLVIVGGSILLLLRAETDL